jgi:hypothetical protein
VDVLKTLVVPSTASNQVDLLNTQHTDAHSFIVNVEGMMGLVALVAAWLLCVEALQSREVALAEFMKQQAKPTNLKGATEAR